MNHNHKEKKKTLPFLYIFKNKIAFSSFGLSAPSRTILQESIIQYIVV